MAALIEGVRRQSDLEAERLEMLDASLQPVGEEARASPGGADQADGIPGA